MKDTGPPSCNLVIVCEYSLSSALDCIQKVIAAGLASCGQVFVIDRLREESASERLRAAATSSAVVSLVDQTHLATDSDLRFLESSPLAFAAVLSDKCLVPPGWLTRLVQPLLGKPELKCSFPVLLGNGPRGMEIWPGETLDSMDALLQSTCPEFPVTHYPLRDCGVWRTDLLAASGTLDRALEQVRRQPTSAVVADNLGVYFHCHNSGSGYLERLFEGRRQNLQQELYPALPAQRFRRTPLRHARESYRALRRDLRNGHYWIFLKSALLAVAGLPFAKEAMATPIRSRQGERSNRLKVTYVLHNITVAGGVISVVQLVNQLALLGVEVKLVCLYQYEETKSWPMYSRPVVYRSKDELINDFPVSDIAIATHWTTASWVREVQQRGRARQIAYFLQDYEPWFFPESDPAGREQVRDTYKMIPNKIVKSDWLHGLLACDGFTSNKINFGLDLGVFYPRRSAPGSRLVVLAMARPRTPRRGFATLCKALELIADAWPKLDIVLFGDDLSSYRLPFRCEDVGVVEGQEDMARLCSRAEIFIDASDFQGFGRTSLEAMATGTACILTKVGGVTEYARHERNCMLVEPNDPQAILDSFLKLASNPAYRQALIRNALETAQHYCHKNEARQALSYFHSLNS